MADTLEILKQLALQVRNATGAAENTAERVGRTLVGILDLLDTGDMPTVADLFEKVNLGTDEAPAWAIRAKYGLYTDSWISAKGKNPSAGSTPVAGATELSKLTDVLLTTPADGQVLTYDATLGKWVNSEPVAGGLDVEELAEYLTTNRYATQDWITRQAYATQQWASGQFALRTVAINAGAGLTGGGTLAADRTLALATVGTAGT